MTDSLIGLGVLYLCLLGAGIGMLGMLLNPSSRCFAFKFKRYLIAVASILVLLYRCFVVLFSLRKEILQNQFLSTILAAILLVSAIIALSWLIYLRVKLDRKIDRDRDWTRLR